MLLFFTNVVEACVPVVQKRKCFVLLAASDASAKGRNFAFPAT
jgi:hypothetical protein